MAQILSEMLASIARLGEFYYTTFSIFVNSVFSPALERATA